MNTAGRLKWAVIWIVAVTFIGGTGLFFSWRHSGMEALVYLLSAAAFTLIACSIFASAQRPQTRGGRPGWFGLLLGLVLIALLVFQPVLRTRFGL